MSKNSTVLSEQKQSETEGREPPNNAGQNLKGNIQKSDDGNIVVRKWIKFQNTECRKDLILTVDI